MLCPFWHARESLFKSDWLSDRVPRPLNYNDIHAVTKKVFLLAIAKLTHVEFVQAFASNSFVLICKNSLRRSIKNLK